MMSSTFPVPREAAFGELVAQFGLGQTFVGFQSLRARLLDGPLPPAGLPGPLLLDLFGLFGPFLAELSLFDLFGRPGRRWPRPGL